MTNIVTRKGLAFGALVALASTAIAGAPAHAAGELNVVPSAGTSYNTLEGTVFNLKTTLAPGFTPSSYDQLRYQIKTDANSTVSYGTGVAAVTNPGTSVAVSTTAVSPLTNGVYSANTVNYLGLKSTTASATTSVEVTAFIDANNDGALTAGEWNTVRTVTFKKVADVNPVVTVAAAATGDTTATATVNWGDLNVEQISRSGAFNVATGSTNSSLAVELKSSRTQTTFAAGSYSSSTGKFTRTVAALQSGDVLTAQAVYATNTYSSSDTYSSVALGTAATATASARTINTTDGLVANLVKGNDAVATSATAIAATTGGVVRTNGSFTVSVVAKDTASTPAVKSGVAVTGSVSTNVTGLQAATSSLTEKSITVNGTKYTTDASLAAATFALTTDANGVASLNISSVGLSAGNTITASFTAQNLTASVATTQTNAAYTVSDDAAAPVVATAKNTAATFNYTIKDQFGVISPLTNERLVVSATQSGGSIATQYLPVTAGKLSFSVTPATDNTNDVTVTVAREVSTTTNGSVSWAANGTNETDRTIKVRAAAYSFSTAPALAQVNGANYDATSNPTQTITQSALADLSTAPSASTTTWAKITLTGSNAGEKLTVSGADFVSIDGAAVAAGSASKIAQAAAVTVYVASNTIGTKTITITNGTVSATVDVKFASAAVNTTNSAVATSVQATAKTFAVAVAAAAQSGRAIDATVTVTDKFGNPVAGFAATASVSGVAVVNGGYTAAVTTDANGQATVKLSAGVNDLGDAVVTFSDNDVNTTTNVTSVAKTVTFGSTDGYIDVLNGKRASVTWSFAKGKRVAVYLDGVRRYNIVQPGDSELNLQFNLKKGSHNIKLVIGGVIVDTISVKVAG